MSNVEDVFNEQQWKALVWVPRCSGTLSCIGSCIIILMILRSYQKKIARPRNRMLLVMSCIDIFSSIAWIYSTAAAPEGSIYGAKGNQATCTLQGFLLTLGTTVPAINTMLCLYFLAVIRYKVKISVFAKKYEKWMFLIALSIPLGTGIVGAIFEIFNPTLTICWIAVKCDHTQTEYECKEDLFQAIFVKTMLIVAMVVGNIYFLIIIGSGIGVWLAVRKPIRDMRNYEFRPQQSGGAESNMITNVGNEDEKETFKQALLYVMAYFITWFPLLFTINLGSRVFVCYLLQGIFTPLQGFWNFFIYIRPKFNTVRKQNLEKNFFWVLKTVVLTKESESSVSSQSRRRHSLPARIGYEANMPAKCTLENLDQIANQMALSALDVELASTEEDQIYNTNISCIDNLPHLDNVNKMFLKNDKEESEQHKIIKRKSI